MTSMWLMKFNHMSTPDQQGKNPESSYVGPMSLYPLQVVLCTLIFHVAGVERRSGLEEHDPALFFGDRLMLDAARDDDEFAFADPFMAFAKGFIAEVHAEAAFDDQEHLVFVVVVMPYEFGVGLHQLDHLSVELAGDMRLVVFGNFREFFGDVDLVHKNPIAAAKKRSQEVGGRRMHPSHAFRKTVARVGYGTYWKLRMMTDWSVDGKALNAQRFIPTGSGCCGMADVSEG